jgi:hypothetical protein
MLHNLTKEKNPPNGQISIYTRQNGTIKKGNPTSLECAKKPIFLRKSTFVLMSYLSIGLDERPAPAGVDLGAAVRAQVDPEGEKRVGKEVAIERYSRI